MSMDLWARVTEDGYLLWASPAHNDDPEPRWPDEGNPEYDENNARTYTLRNVPADLAQQLLNQGTYEQSFSDGYLAWDAARPYATGAVSEDTDPYSGASFLRTPFSREEFEAIYWPAEFGGPAAVPRATRDEFWGDFLANSNGMSPAQYHALNSRPAESAQRTVREDEDVFKAMRPVRVTYSDGSTMVTNINGTRAEITRYYVGQTFNVGSGGDDLLLRAVAVEFLDEPQTAQQAAEGVLKMMTPAEAIESIARGRSVEKVAEELLRGTAAPVTEGAPPVQETTVPRRLPAVPPTRRVAPPRLPYPPSQRRRTEATTTANVDAAAMPAGMGTNGDRDKKPEDKASGAPQPAADMPPPSPMSGAKKEAEQLRTRLARELARLEGRALPEEDDGKPWDSDKKDDDKEKEKDADDKKDDDKDKESKKDDDDKKTEGQRMRVTLPNGRVVTGVFFEGDVEPGVTPPAKGTKKEAIEADQQYQVGEQVVYTGAEPAIPKGAKGSIIIQHPNMNSYAYNVNFEGVGAMVVPHENLQRIPSAAFPSV